MKYVKSTYQNLFLIGCTLFLVFYTSQIVSQNNKNIIVDEYSPYLINTTTLGRKPIGGDTIFIAATRTHPLRFESLEGESNKPIVITNLGGQVKIEGSGNDVWGALIFENSKHIKISGNGHQGFKYGFHLSADQAGIAITELSSDCEVEFVKISHDAFFGIIAKKDYHGNPPLPIPVFQNLSIHDCFIEGVSEGMYLGETVSPGMEFKKVKIYNNIVRNTRRESIQIANMTEDVEIYNNTLLNAGLDETIYHLSNIQVGDNSVADIHHNIIIGAPKYGVINFGKGNVTISDNFIANNKGIFCDSRTIYDVSAPIHIESNFFRAIQGTAVVKNRNEHNFLTAINNKYEGDIEFYYDETDAENESVSENYRTFIPEIRFVDTLNSNYTLSSTTFPDFLEMGAPGGTEFFKHVDQATIPRQLVITPEMVADSVSGGSIDSPLFMFDEQDIDFASNENPISISWKPDDGMNQNSYHAVVDFGDEFFLTDIYLHDMESTENFTVEYYAENTWQTLFVEPCDAYQTWKKHSARVQTRYLRFSMYEDPNAAINEVIVYGYPARKRVQQIIVESDMVSDLIVGGSVDSPNYLFDEQTNYTNLGLIPSSPSWKPFYNNQKAPYYAEVDLGQDYHISRIKMHDMHDREDFEIQYKKADDWITLVHENCDGFKVWKEHETDAVTRYLRMVMPNSPFANINEILLYGYPVMSFPVNNEGEYQQIPVESYMVNDLVHRGSLDNPRYLFDEQYIDPYSEDKPTSKSWKPYYNNTKAPYYAEVNLVKKYKISKIFLHDMHATDDFIIEYQDNYSNWVHLVTEPCDDFNVWKIHDVEVVTKKLRFSMLTSPYASINEVLLFGNLIEDDHNQDKSGTNLFDKGIEDNTLETVSLYPNPVRDRLYLNGVNASASYHEIKVIDVLGKTIYCSRQTNVLEREETIKVDLNSVLMERGTYILRYQNDQGQQQAFTFIKN